MNTQRLRASGLAPAALPVELWVGGSLLLPKAAMLAEVTGRYRKSRPARRA